VISNAPSTAQLLLNYQKKENRYCLHILHYVPERRSQLDLVEDPLPLVDLKIGIRMDSPKKVATLSGKELAVEYKAGRAWIEIGKLVGHELVLFEL